ncbi:MAG: hypothetical protein ACE5FO_09820 [Parvularculaceae bacterium]
MRSQPAKLKGIMAHFAYAGRRFNAWWEGFDFDETAERANIAARYNRDDHLSDAATAPEYAVSEAIWGEGRLEPGNPAWTLNLARTLALPTRADVMVLGAGAGAPLRDLRNGSKWKVSGLTRAELKLRDGRLRSYEQALQRLNAASADGLISFFELHRDPDPAAFARFAGELMVDGAKAAFVDFTVARKGARLRSCFSPPLSGSPRMMGDYERALRAAGFSVSEAADETAAFLPLIARGWARWKRVYDMIREAADTRRRVELIRMLNILAYQWAERFDALRSGQLQVTRFQATRR